MLKKIISVLISGLIMGLANAPVSAFYLAWVGLIPLWILLRKSEVSFTQGDLRYVPQNFLIKRQDLIPNYLITNQGLINYLKSCFNWLCLPIAWGVGYYGLSLFWITGVHPMTWMGVPWLASLLIAIACWLLVTVWGVILVSIWAIGMKIYQSLKAQNYWFKIPLIEAISRVIMGVALWSCLEYIWSQSPLWWSSLALTQSPNNLVILQLGKVSGFTTITAALVGINGLLAEAILNFRQQAKLTALILGITCLFLAGSLSLVGFNLWQVPLNDLSNQQIKVGLIQGNIPNTIKLYPEGWRKAIEGYTKGYQILSEQQVDLIVTPETALPFFWQDIVKYNSLYPQILTNQVPLVLGAFGNHKNGYTNSLFALDSQGNIVGRFDKIKLVPLGEYIPFQSVLGSIIQRLSPLDNHLAVGNPQQILKTPVGQAIAGICYESAFSEHFRRQTAQGGEFMITASNNAHYSAAMPAQHHAQDLMRAIENDRWMARVTNTGYSAIVNPHGETIWLSGINTYEIYADYIYRRQTKTLYVLWGDWLTKVLLGMSILLIIYKK